MNMNEWIKSGIIESYVLGDLSEDEMREVEEMAQKHPEVQKEIEQTEITLEGLAMRAGLQPKNDIKSRILQNIDSTEVKATPPKEASQPEESQPPKVKPIEAGETSSRGIKLWQYWSAAASVLLIFSTVLAIYYRQQWQSTETVLENYLTENQNLEQEYQALRSDYNKLEEQQEIFASPEFTQVKLKGTDLSPSSSATVFWNPDSQKVFLSALGLPAPASGKQYQLWAIVDGKPQNAGIFDLQNQLLGMQNISNASAFAITLEPEGGSVNPTLEAMYVIGNV